MKTISLRRHLTWYMVAAILTMSLLSGAGVYYGTTHEAEEMFNASLVQTARLLDGLINQNLIESEPHRLINALTIPEGLDEHSINGHEYEDKLFFAVLNPDGNMIIKSPHAPAFNESKLIPGFTESVLDGKLWTIFLLLSRNTDYRILVGARNDIHREMTKYILRGLELPVILLLPVILWLLQYVVKLALRPLQKVSDEVREQDFRKLKTINVEGVPNEINPLVNSLNQMITNLDSAYTRERRFVSDASHELRNPLAALLINVENAIEESENTDQRASLSAMRSSIVRLSHLVSQLLELSHMENPLSSRNFELVNLQQICRQIVDNHQAQAKLKQQTLELQETNENCTLNGSTPLLISLVSNLVDNAIKYSAENCQIRVGCQREQGTLVLRVDDSGPGLNAEMRQKVLQRFIRANQSNTNGAGLGLSIAKSIVHAHGAVMDLGDSDLGGLSITIRF